MKSTAHRNEITKFFKPRRGSLDFIENLQRMFLSSLFVLFLLAVPLSVVADERMLSCANTWCDRPTKRVSANPVFAKATDFIKIKVR